MAALSQDDIFAEAGAYNFIMPPARNMIAHAR